MTCRGRPGSLYPGKTCDCAECRPIRLRTMKHYTYRRLRVTGRDDARAVLNAYLAAGYSPHRVATLTGLASSAVFSLAGERDRRMTQTTVTAILGLPMPPPPFLVGATRRLQALARLGWGLYDVAQRTGIPRATLSAFRNRPPSRCADESRITAILEVYNELCMTLAPDDRFHNKTRRLAERRGWAPPLAWDDETIDDPTAEPDYGSWKLGYSTRRLPDTDTLVAEVNRSGVRIAAERYAVKPSSVRNALRRAGYRASSTGDTRDLPTYMRRVEKGAA